MKKFVVLYHSSSGAADQMAKATPEQAKAGMDAWMAWSKEAGTAIVDLGAPLGHATKVTPSAASRSGSTVTGFSILQGESLDSLANLLRKHPHHHAPGASLEVLELLAMPGM